MNYLTLSLSATLTRSSASTPALQVQVLRSPAGEMREPLSLPFDPVHLLHHSGSALEFGRRLFETLFPHHPEESRNARGFLVRSLDRILGERDGQTGLRISLQLSPALQIYPWELMAFNRNGGEPTPADALALHAKVSIVRYESLALPADAEPVPAPVRCLFSGASPDSERLPPLDIGRAMAVGTSARQLGNLDLVPLLPASIRALDRALRVRPTPVFIFFGHGFFPGQAEVNEPGRIFLQDERGREEIHSADDLAVQLRNAGVRLAVFISCSGADRSAERFWTGIAPALQNSGVAAVIAMQGKISEAAGLAFLEALLEALDAAETLDEALALARAGLAGRFQDWYKPVLYSRSDSGRLFSIPARSSAKTPAEVQVRIEAREVHGTVIGAIVNDPWSGRVEVEQLLERVTGKATGIQLREAFGGSAKVSIKADSVEQGGEITGLVIGRESGISRSKPDSSRKVDFAIMTPIAKEYVEIQKILSEPRPVPDAAMPATLGRIGRHSALCMLLGKGEADAAVGMAHCLKEWQPRKVILAGIAGSLNSRKLNRGDILVATGAFSLDFGKIEKGRFLRRPDNDLRFDPILLSQAEVFAEGASSWRELVPSQRPDGKRVSESKVVFGACLSGNQVVDDLAYPLVKEALAAVPEALAIEMEAAGAGAAIRRRQAEQAIGFLMVRGISDEVEVSAEAGAAGEGTRHRTEWKHYVTGAVGAYIQGLLEGLR